MSNTTDLTLLSVENKRCALIGVAKRWTSILIDLGGYPHPVPFKTDVALLATAVQPLCSPLFTIERISDLMFLLSTDVQRLDLYRDELAWEGEDSILTAMTHEERLAFLTRAVDRDVFGLIHGVEPCITCMDIRSWGEWKPQVNAQHSQYRCQEHGMDELEAWRRFNRAHRAAVLTLHDGARLTEQRDIDTFGGRP